jgi:hypothetical protein
MVHRSGCVSASNILCNLSNWISGHIPCTRGACVLHGRPLSGLLTGQIKGYQQEVVQLMSLQWSNASCCRPVFVRKNKGGIFNVICSKIESNNMATPRKFDSLIVMNDSWIVRNIGWFDAMVNIKMCTEFYYFVLNITDMTRIEHLRLCIEGDEKEIFNFSCLTPSSCSK